MRTGVQTEDLKRAFVEARSPLAFRNMDASKGKPIICVLCNVAARIVLVYKENGATVEELSRTVKTLCTNIEIETEKVCNGVIDLNIVRIFSLLGH